MSVRTRAGWLAWVVAIIAVIAALTRMPEKRRTEHQAPLLPRPEILRVVGAAHLNLIADYYWIQGIQAVGKAMTGDEYRDIYFYMDLATTIDPDFEVIYRFAGAAIPTNLGRETWVNTKESTSIMEKGLKRFPDQLGLRILLAYNYSYFDKDYARAGEVLERAIKLPGAPLYLGPLVTRLYAKGGRVESALELAHSMLEVETNPGGRALFEKRIRQLETERVLQGVDQAAALFRDNKGAPASSVMQLIAEGFLAQIPIDPSGGTVFLDDAGVAQTTAQPRLDVHTEAKGTDW